MVELPPVWEDGRVAEGMRRQLALPRDRHAGWKLGLGSEAARANLGTSGPLVGFLLEGGRVASGAEYSIAGWTRPVLEAEIAVELGSDVPAGSTREQAADAIVALRPALELVDIARPLDDPVEILGANIFQRGYVLGEPVRDWRSLDFSGIGVHLERDGEEVGATTDPTAAVGHFADLVRHAADYVGAFGESLRSGQVMITGMLVPAIEVAPGQHVRLAVDRIGEVEVRFTG